jgi:LPPG:FO 2-phospho-L-lactate transferase
VFAVTAASQGPSAGTRVVALAGGVGGAKLAFGLDRALAETRATADATGRDRLTVIVNTADDLEVHGLHVSPDLDTVMYTLAGLADRERGWGLEGETWQALAMLQRYGAETWFRLGDRDLATHVRRTARLREGAPLSVVTDELARALGVRAALLPMSDDPVRTGLRTTDGWLAFQEWFVRRRQADIVSEIRFDGAAVARPAPGVREAIAAASLVVLCPSNPLVSIAPILAIPGILESLLGTAAPVVAVSPIVAGRALRGPADRMLGWSGVEVSAAGVAQLYAERYARLLDGFVVDRRDAHEVARVESLGMQCLVTDAVIDTDTQRTDLARAIIDWAEGLRRLA